MRLQYRTAIVTGASSGIGAELARQLAAAGVRVGLTARRADALHALADEIRANGGIAAVAPADAGDREATRSAFARLAEELGPIDLMIANAGLGLSTPAAEFSAEKIEAMVRVNLLGAVYAIEAVLPEMLRRGAGHIVGISSLAAYRGVPWASGYCATKAGLTALLEALRIELKCIAKGVAVTTVHPGYTDTPMYDALGADMRRRGVAVTVVHPGYVRTPMTEGGGHQPFLMEVGPAARIILKGIAARKRQIAFPWQAELGMTLARLMPGPLYDRLAARFLVPREPRARPQ